MILQQLYRDADAILKQTMGQGLPPSMYLRKKVRWIIELNDGEPPQFTPLAGEGKGGDRGLEMLVPNRKRTVGISPLLFADKPSYALGVRIADAKADAGRDLKKDTQRTAEEFDAFRQLISACAEQTGNLDARHVADFLATWQPGNPFVKLPSDMTRDNIITFRVNGRFVIENAAVQQFWAGYGQSAEAEEDEASGMQCLVSGARGQVEEMMPVPVKGLPGGKSEMAVVSANSAAFESYGLKRAQTSPICRDAGEQFGQALNALLASPDHHALVQSATYIFWSPQGVTRLPLFDPQEIREFLDAARSGRRWYVSPPSAPFFLFGLTANAARVAVRSAIETTVGKIEEQQKEWFQRLSVIGFNEANQLITDRAFPIKTLAVASYREFKDIAPGVEDALLRAALTGEHLPVSLLNLLVNRCRAEHTITHPRAALMKYIVTQHLSVKEADNMVEEVTVPHPPGMEGDDARAYHLGRLFAELEEIQSQAIPGINAGIADRYYGSASTMPAAVFGSLLEGVQNHLSKLRKERERAYHGAQKRIEEIMECVDQFPKTLPLKSQALFSLGYYHHRAARRKAIAKASADKKAAKAQEDAAVVNDPAYAQGGDDE
jgi:CRISPR-associated protein Csd1